MDNLIDFGGTGTLVVLFLIVILVLLIAYVTGRFKVAGANEALVRTGGLVRAPAQLRVVRAGRVVVLPLVHKLGRLHLSARLITVSLSDAVTKQGIKVAVQGVATVKIGGDDESIRNAAERFVDREDQIESIVKNVLEGSLRSIVGTLTVEELNYDRQKFQQEVQSAAKGDLATSGLTIDNFTIQAIRDEVGYMDLIGQQETARRERDARMAKAGADQEAAVREAEAQQEVVRRQTELAQLEADRKQKELLAVTIRPAEADAEAQVRRAEGEKQARIAAAQAEAERVKLAGQAEAAVQVTKGEAQAKVTEVNAQATAKQVTLEGNAEAGIVFNKGEAEAKALALRAEAYRQFNEAAIISTVLSMLPEIVRAAAEPMSAIDNLTVLSSDGASEVVRNATRTVAEASTTIKGLTGIDVPALLQSALGSETAAAPMTRATAPARRPGSRSGGGEEGDTGGRGAGGRDEGGAPTPGGGPAAGGGPATEAAPEPSGGPDAAAAGQGPEPSTAGPATEADVAQERLARAAETIRATATTTPPPGVATPPSGALAGLTSALPPHPPVSDVRPGDRRRAAAGAALGAAGMSEATRLDEAASRLAGELSRIPGIERFGGTRLGDLDRSGPRALRTLWAAARGQLQARYGDQTIGSLLDQLQRDQQSGPGTGR